jgi:hypothetical protein
VDTNRASRASELLRMNTYKAEVQRRRSSVPGKATMMAPQRGSFAVVP